MSRAGGKAKADHTWAHRRRPGLSGTGAAAGGGASSDPEPVLPGGSPALSVAMNTPTHPTPDWDAEAPAPAMGQGRKGSDQSSQSAT